MVLVVDPDRKQTDKKAALLEQNGFTVVTGEYDTAADILRENGAVDLAVLHLSENGSSITPAKMEEVFNIRDLPVVYCIEGEGPEDYREFCTNSCYGVVEHNALETTLVETVRTAYRLADAEEKNRRYEEELNAVYAHTQVVFAVLDKDTRINKVNAYTTSYTGMKKEGILDNHIGYALNCIHHLHDPKGCGSSIQCEHCELRALIRETLDTGNPQYKKEVSLRVFDDTIRSAPGYREVTFEVSAAPVAVLEESGVFVTLEDITARKKMQNELLLSETKFRQIFNGVKDAIFLHYLNSDGSFGNFFEVNQAAVDMLGYSREELLTLSPVDIDAPEDLHIIPNVLNDLSQRGNSTFEMRQIAQDGTVIPAEISATLFRLVGRDCIVAVVRDLTDRKLILRKMRKDLEEKNVLLKEIHHRVKNNLSIVMSLLNLELDEIDEKGRLELSKDLLHSSRDRIYSMALVHEKLYQSSNLAHIDMNDYVSSLVNELSSAYGSGKIEIDMDIDDIHLDIVCSIPCGLILNELITNSLIHGFAGTDGGRINISLHRLKEAGIELTVGDNGIGLPDGFSMQTVSSLGLRLVHLLTEQLEGTLSISSRPETEFRITFPY